MIRWLLVIWFGLCAPAFAGSRESVAPGIDPKPGAQIPLSLPVTDAQGHHATLGELTKGKPILLAPLVHRCPNICGVALEGLAAAWMALPEPTRARISVVAFGIDPREGSADALATIEGLRLRYPNLPPVHATTSAAKATAAMTNALGYRYVWDEPTQQYIHPVAAAMLTADGRLVRWIDGLSPTPDELSLAIDEAETGRPDTIVQRFLLLCSSLDPTTGRNSGTILFALQIAGGLMVMAGALAIGFALRRERPA